MASADHLFCTYLDSNYLDRGLCLWDSLKRHFASARLLICCLDEKAYNVLTVLQLPGIQSVPLSEIENNFPNLTSVKSTRSKVEYFFTITPTLIRYALEKNLHVDMVTYLDSDLFFFSSPKPLFDEIANKNGNVAIVAHRFPERLRHLTIYGIYNVGWVSFRRTPPALTCLHEWQRNCNDWCHDYVDGDRFADQKYLDAWPSKYDGVVVLQHLGANVALWNVEIKPIRSKKKQVKIGEDELIFYHFHGLSQFGRRSFFTSARMYGLELHAIVRHRIYGPYMSALRRNQSKLRYSKVRPLRRYKHSGADVAYAKRHPFSGLFLYSIFETSVP